MGPKHRSSQHVACRRERGLQGLARAPLCFKWFAEGKWPKARPSTILCWPVLCGLPKGTGPTRPGPSATHVVPRHWPNRPGPSRPGRSVRCRVWEVGLEGLAQPAQCSREASRGRGHTDHARAALFYPTWACRREVANSGPPERPYAHQPCQQPSQKNGESIGGWEGG